MASPTGNPVARLDKYCSGLSLQHMSRDCSPVEKLVEVKAAIRIARMKDRSVGSRMFKSLALNI